MANVNSAFGLWPERKVSGQPWNGAANIYYLPSTYASNVFLGDPVVPTGAADANGIPVVTLATAGASNNILGPMIGVVNGGEPIIPVTRDLPVYRQASVSQYILVADDPEMLFKIQEDGNAGANAAWSNANLVAGSGSTVTGYSGWQLSSSSSATTNTLQVRMITPIRQPDNAIGTNCKWLVRIMQHSLTALTGV